MEDERWQAVNMCVGCALEQAPTVRASWLRAACAGDGELLAKAETLLRAATFTGGLLSVSTTLDSSDSSDTSTAAGTRRRELLGTIGHYELREWLGAGGMGQVFLARDLALGRDVALKLLPDRFTPDLRVQLMREADSSSKLQHPAIATFYDTGEEGGEAFIAMEYVIGHTLRSRLAGGPLPFAEALAITRCLLEALEHAHAAGILHRDIKPENVMVISPRAAKLLDFGLAKHLIAPAESVPTNLTVVTRSTDVRVAGTVGYMAPEQLLGDPLDARTDVFQVGAVFYEMLAGTPAFPGASPLERMAAIMSRDPDTDTVAWASLPPGCRVVVSRAVARDRSRRYPSAAAFLRDLEDLVDGRIATELPKIVAVLDFENLTGDPGSDWLGSGVAETLRAELARIPDLTVVSRENVQNAIRSLKRRSRNADALSVGLQVSCGWAVSGTIQQCGRQLRITLQLLVIPTQRVAASEIVDGTSDDIFVMQGRLAKVVAVALGASTSASGAPRHASLDVHECLTRARLLLERLDKNAVEHARELLEHAVNLDGNYAPALSALAGAYGLRSIATTDPEDLSKALHFATRAIELDPRHAEGHIWKGYVLARQSRFAETALASRRASELDPANPLPLYLAGSSLLFVGQRNDALPLIQRAVDLDPRGGMAWLALGTTHLCLDQLKQARYCFLQARETEANSARYPCAGAAAYVAEVYRLEGNVNAARALALTGVEDVERSDHAYRDSFRAYALVVLGRSALDQTDNVAARAAFQQVLTQARGRPRTRSCGHVVVQALAGLARADDDAGRLDEACMLFDRRDTFNFEPFYGMLDDLTLVDLAQTAHSIGFHDRAQTLLVRARQAGSPRS